MMSYYVRKLRWQFSPVRLFERVCIKIFQTAWQFYSVRMTVLDKVEDSLEYKIAEAIQDELMWNAECDGEPDMAALAEDLMHEFRGNPDFTYVVNRAIEATPDHLDEDGFTKPFQQYHY